MQVQNNKRAGIFVSEASNLNNQNQSKRININRLNLDNIPIKNEELENNYRNIKRIVDVKKIHLSPSSPNYQSGTFNSHTQLKSKINILDSISEKEEVKEKALSREKKIYLYLRNNGKKNNNDSKSIPETPKSIIKNRVEIIDRLNLDIVNKQENEEIENNFNRTNIINNINNNNVNNIFVNFISSNMHNDVAKDLAGTKLNNSFNKNFQNNSIVQDGFNKTTRVPKIGDNSKIIYIRNDKSQPKLKVNKHLIKDEKNKENKLDYFTKIMFTANSFIFNRNNPFNKGKQPTDPTNLKKHKNKNKNIKHGEKSRKQDFVKNKKSLKDYIMKNKLKENKNKIAAELKKSHNSYSAKKENKHFIHNNQSNPIFINIISNRPFQNNINEKNEFNITISNKKEVDKKLVNSSTTKILVSKYNKNSVINSFNITQNNNIKYNNNNKNDTKIISNINYKSIDSLNNIKDIIINNNINNKNINNITIKNIDKTNNININKNLNNEKLKNHINSNINKKINNHNSTGNINNIIYKKYNPNNSNNIIIFNNNKQNLDTKKKNNKL